MRANFSAARQRQGIRIEDISTIRIKKAKAALRRRFHSPNILLRTIRSASFSATTFTRRSVRDSAREFIERGRGAKIHLKQVENPQRFGVPIVNGDRIVKIEEKPKVPKSDYAVTGLYMYDHSVFDIIKTLKPSGRGELEITDVNNALHRPNEMSYAIVDGWWSDAGTFDSLLRANILVASQL